MAAVEKLRLEKGDAAVDEATCSMGLSLGEYSALCFAGALSFEDGVKVTKARYLPSYNKTARKVPKLPPPELVIHGAGFTHI